MRVHQLHFGLLQGPQPPVVVPSPSVCFSVWRSQVYLGGFWVVCILLMVVRGKCELTFPSIGGSASVYSLVRR